MKRVFGVVVFIVILHVDAFCQNTATVQKGVLDLQNHNWQKDGIVKVSGDWEFYWDKFYYPDFFKDASLSNERRFAFVPDFWNKYIATDRFSHRGFGYATYRVKILCPTSPEPLALKLL